jgi:predicted ATPase
MRHALAEHDEVLAGAVAAAHGQLVKSTGDGIMAVFETAGGGIIACLAAQEGLRRVAWGDTGPLRVRMGLHVGEGSGDGADFHGPAVNRAARIMAAGHGGQILLSGSTAALVMDALPPGTALRDLGEHQLKDLARAERLFQLDYPAMPDAFAPLVTADVRIGRLPAEPSPFVGRETELSSVAQRLADPAVRLLTLTGPGGIGKTRLALRAAQVSAAAFDAGAAFVDLSAARDTTGVLTTIARELGFRDASEEALLGELVAGIGARQLLLVLDNVEQVTAAAPTLLQLLAGCPGLTLLVTSREPLHVRGEHVVIVPPFDLPRDTDAASAARLEQFEAVLLFVERARAVRPDFRVTDDNAALVADICRRLEGVPLAIELAVARLRVFSLGSLRDRLASPLRALGSGPRDLPERQQTLRATIDWSFQLLPVAEQQLFAVLASFAGTDIEALEAVVAELAERLPGVDPVEGLVSLTEKSLLRQVERDEDAPRFEMLQSVRDYAQERLEMDVPLARDARAAHARYYGAWAARQATRLRGADRSAALRALGEELENLRAAWRGAVDARDLGLVERLLAGLSRLYDARGWYRALIALAEEALEVVGSCEPSPERDALAISLRSDHARALSALHGFTDEVEAAYDRLLDSLDGSDVPQLYPVLRGLASFYSFRSDHARAADVAGQMLALAEHTGDPEMRAEAHLFAGTGASFSGRITDGLPLLEASIAAWTARPYQLSHLRLGPDPRVSTLTALSLLSWWQGRIDTSLARSLDALELARRLEHPSTSGYALHHAALLRLWRQEPDEARGLAVQVIEAADEHDLPIWSAVGSVVLGAAAVALGVHDEGLAWMADGLERYRGLRTPPVFWPFLLQLRAEACLRASQLAAGLDAAEEALTLAPMLPDLHLVHGDLLRDRGEVDAATAAYELGLASAQGWGAATPALRSAIRLCRLGGASASVVAARRVTLGAIVETFQEGGSSPDMVEARAILGEAA